MISIKKAIKIVSSNTSAIGVESVGIVDSLGRVLAEPIIADRDLPPFDRSTMDGFAFASLQKPARSKGIESLQKPARSKGIDSLKLTIIGESAAGNPFNGRVNSGEAVRIMTGAAVPLGADTVLRQEDTESIGDEVILLTKPKSGSSIVKRGTEARTGDAIIRSGVSIDERNIAAAAAFGYTNLSVSRVPKVTIIPTGSELVGVHESPEESQIRDSNSLMLAGSLRRYAILPRIAKRRGDDLRSITNAIRSAARNSDLIILTGGVSVGKYDLTTDAIRQAGGEIFFEKVKMKPGKPTVFARLDDTLIFGLPGNPMSAFVAFRVFVSAALERMMGLERQTKHLYAIAGAGISAAKGRDTFVPCSIEANEKGLLVATPVRSRGSGDIVAISRADCFVFIHADTSVETGGVVEVLPISG